MSRKPVHDYVSDFYATHTPGPVRPSIICKDGTIYSVQASAGHYCSPRDNVGPWSTFEVWPEHRKGPIGWVPRDQVNRWIHRHGGLA